MERYEIPESVKELFTDDSHYQIVDYNFEMDNNEAMRYFIEQVGIPASNILLDDGTQVHFQHPDYNYHIVIDCSGMGDTFSHQYDVTRITFDDYKKEIEDSNDNISDIVKDLMKKDSSEITFEDMNIIFEDLYIRCRK